MTDPDATPTRPRRSPLWGLVAGLLIVVVFIYPDAVPMALHTIGKVISVGVGMLLAVPIMLVIFGPSLRSNRR